MDRQISVGKDCQATSSGSGLARPTVIGIGLGDFGLALYWQTASLYLLYFYTDVLHISPVTAGAIYMGALVWDATVDPLVGAFADATRSSFGRYRPYLLLGGLPLAVGFVLMFSLPAYSGPFSVAAAAVTLIIFRTCYAVVSVPYSALTAHVTRRSDERTRLTVVRLLFGTTGGVMVALTALPASEALRSNSHPVLGWMLIGGVFATIATIFLIVAARATRTLDLPAADAPPSPNFRKKLRTSLTNRPLMILLAAIVVTSCTSTMFNKGLVYYFKYVLADARLASIALSFMAIVVGLSVPLWGLVATRFSKRSAWLLGLAPMLAGILLWRIVDGRSTFLVFVALGLIALGTGATVTAYWAMLPDTVEFGEWRSGVRSESLGYGLVAFGQKVAFGTGGGLLGLLLSNIGYVAGVTQSPQTLAQFKAILFYTPLIGVMLTGALVMFYPLSPVLHKKMVADIAARQSAE